MKESFLSMPLSLLALFWLFHYQADLGPAVAQIQIWKLYSLPVRATHQMLLTCSMESPPFGPMELQLSMVELGIPQMGHQAVSKWFAFDYVEAVSE